MPELTKDDLAMIRTCLIWTRVATSGPLRKQLTGLIDKIKPEEIGGQTAVINRFDNLNYNATPKV